MDVQKFNILNKSQEKDPCQLCQGQNFQVMLNRALYDRYLANINMYYTDQIDDFIQQQITPQTCKFRQQLCDANDQELLKRQYAFNQFNGKIQMLSEYYKFHRDIPKIFQKSVFKILTKYHDRLRHFDYKKIKCLLKQEQGISLTTQKSDQTSIYSDQVLKSRYSTVLDDLDKNSQSQSQILQDFCQKVDKVLQKVHFKKDFKGQYYSGEKKFQQYLLSMKRVNHKINKTPFQGQNVKIKNYNLLNKPQNNIQLHNFGIKSQRVESRKKSLSKKNPQITFQNNNALKQSLKNFKKIKNKNMKSIQKTTANQTISRDQKSKRLQKLQKTLEYEIQKNHNQMFKPFSTAMLGLKPNAMFKTLDQIYKPSLPHQKYNSDKSRKGSQSNIQQLNKIYENKLSSRKSSQKIKSKPISYHNSKDINPDHKDVAKIEQNGQNFIHSNTKKQHQTEGPSSVNKKLTRSKSASKTLTSHKKSSKNILITNIKSSKKQLKTIDQQDYNNVNYRKGQKQNMLDNFIHNKQKIQFHQKNEFLKISQKAKQHKPSQNSRNSFSKKKSTNQSSRKSLVSANKQRNKSKSNILSSNFKNKQTLISKPQLHSTQKIQLNNSQKLLRNQSKSHVNSARNSQIDKVKFNTIDPQANKKKIQNFLQKKLKMVSHNPVKTNKFFN